MATVTTTELSNEMIERIANKAAGIACERIGDALTKVSVVGLKVSVAGMLIGLGCIAVGTYIKKRRRGGCPCHEEGSPMVIKCTDMRTGACTRFSAADVAAPPHAD